MRRERPVLALIMALIAVALGIVILFQNPENPERGMVFGGHEWRILYMDYGNNAALIITENIIETRPFHHRWTSMTWEESDIRQYLNTEFLKTFTEYERERILPTNVINEDNPWFHTPGGSDTLDYIFLLSIREAEDLFYDMPDRIAIYSPAASWWQFWNRNGAPLRWWLRSPGMFGFAAYVGDNGFVRLGGGNVDGSHPHDYRGGDGFGLRPALWIRME